MHRVVMSSGTRRTRRPTKFIIQQATRRGGILNQSIDIALLTGLSDGLPFLIMFAGLLRGICIYRLFHAPIHRYLISPINHIH